MTNRSPAKLLADELLGEPIERWLDRKAKNGRTVREIAAELAARTEGKVAVTHATIARWLNET